MSARLSSFNSTFSLSLFHHDDSSKGHGVKTNEYIKSNTFIIEYKGKVLSMGEAEQQELKYANEIPDPGCYMFYCSSGPNKFW